MKALMSAIVAILFSVGVAHGSVITTTFASNNGQSGNMFDVVNLVGDLTVTGFDLNLDDGTFDIEIYSKSGSYLGFETDASAWSLIDTGSVTSAGIDLATFFDVSDFLLSGLSTTSLYITTTGSTAMNYTNGSSAGSVYADNGELQILEGVGKSAGFGSTFSPRIWNGSIYYETAGSGSSVPAPASILLFGLGLVGIGLSRRKSNLSK